LLSCNNSTLAPNTDRLGYQFFPLSANLEQTYAVEEIAYRVNGTIDTLRYFIIDRILDSTLVDGRIILQGYRIERLSDNSERILSTLEIERDPYTLLQNLGNEAELKLSFPVDEDLAWNGRPKNETPDFYNYTNVFQAYETDDTIFNQTIEVIQEDNQDSIQTFDKRVEVYAANIGMVYSLSSFLDFCNQTECLGLQEIDSGKTITMRRIF